MAKIKSHDGVELYAEATGQGVPVVLSCAYCTTHENFRPQVDALAQAGMRVILWDYRGHGLSDAPAHEEAYSLERVIEDLRCVLDWAAPGQKAVVGGLSFGGLASLHFYLRYPERVRALLLLDSGPGFKNPEAQARWTQQVERLAEFLESKGLEGLLQGPAAETAVGRNRELPAAQAAARAIQAQDPRGVARFGRFVSGRVPGVIDELSRIEVPALVLVGERDQPYLRAAEVMAAKLPKSIHRVLPGAGHIGNIECAEAFNEELLRFLLALPPDEVQ